MKKTWNILNKNSENFIFFNIHIHKKFKERSINIKNYTAHPHDMVHIPAKFWENISMRFRVTVRKLNVTDGQGGGRCYISRHGPSAPRDNTSNIVKKILKILFFSIFKNSYKIPSISKTTSIQHTPMTWCTYLQSFEKIYQCIFELQCEN